MTPKTTLNEIRRHTPCEGSWKKLLKHLGKIVADNDPVTIRAIYESNGLDDALWSLRVLPNEMDNAVRLLACDLVGPALQFVPAGESRPKIAVDVTRRFARSEATADELAAARGAAQEASRLLRPDWAPFWAALAASLVTSPVAAWYVRKAAFWATMGIMSAAWDASWGARVNKGTDDDARDDAASKASLVAHTASREYQARIFEAWLDQMDAEK